MVPADFESFFVAMSGVAAALIGLLFVAISVAPHRFVEAETRLASQARAGSALIALSNVLIVSAVGLIPGATIGWLAILLGVGGVAYAAAQARGFLTAHQPPGAWVPLIVGLLVLFGWELVEGITLMIDPRHGGAVSTIAGLLVASLVLGIGRSWRLVGMSDTGLTRSLSQLLRGAPPDE